MSNEIRAPENAGSAPSPLDTNLLLVDARQGDGEARDQLFSHVYGELQRVARSQLKRSSGSPIQTTELVHEAYLRLCRSDLLTARDRSHFFALAATAMRHILVDHFRQQSALKRGGLEDPRTLDEEALQLEGGGGLILAVDEALSRLRELDERCARIVELKFFGGMTESEIAEALEVSVRTVSGGWRRARAWLMRELESA